MASSEEVYSQIKNIDKIRIHDTFPTSTQPVGSGQESDTSGKEYSNVSSKALRNFNKDPWNYPFDPGK